MDDTPMEHDIKFKLMPKHLFILHHGGERSDASEESMSADHHKAAEGSNAVTIGKITQTATKPTRDRSKSQIILHDSTRQQKIHADKAE
jgi:hypothetical protein